MKSLFGALERCMTVGGRTQGLGTGKARAISICLAGLAALALNTPAAMAQTATFSILHSFDADTDGAQPEAALVRGNDGNFYGTTSTEGGIHRYGTVFKITPSGTLATLHAFTAGTDEGWPEAKLVQDSDGNLYGTTNGVCNTGVTTCNGPANYSGTVFKIAPSGAFTTLYVFIGGTNGGSPVAGLVQGSDGDFYGTTSTSGDGFSYSFGTVFKITPAGVLTTLYSFSDGPNGGYPTAGLVQGSDDSFYGTTSHLGNGGYGTVFKITAAGRLTTLYSFTGFADGAYASGLIEGSDGNFYGTTMGNIGPVGTRGVGSYGTVFKITPAGVLTTLYAFKGGADGGTPEAGLVEGSDGNFYGTTSTYGGNSSSGTVFKITPAGVLTTLHYFNVADGSAPKAELTWGSDGSLYGTTESGGANGDGTVFRVIALPAATPTFAPAGGTYADTQSVTISNSTTDATIHYTTDGSTPTSSSAQYTGAISVASSTTIKAIAVASGYLTSAVASASYTITPPAATPTFSPAGGTYSSTQSVTIGDATSGAAIYYTTDGSTPTAGSTKYIGPISITKTETLKAIATASGYSTSATASATFTITPPAATPAFSPAGGTYTSTQSVTISDSTSGAAIHYTTDGSTPTASSPTYSGPIAVSKNQTIKAIATASGYAASSVASATYTITPPAATPTFSPSGGTFASTQSVTISDSTSGATIYYTMDGSTPTTGSTRYSGPITVSSTKTLKAVATASGYSASAVASTTYTITPPAATPTISPAGGTFTSAPTVTISDGTVGATIYFTTDGSTPTSSSNQYTGPIAVASSLTLKAIAVANGYTQSTVASAAFTITPPTATPAFSPGGGTYTSAQSVTISDGTAGATIYYTTDGNTPTASSAKYSAPITVASSITLKAIAIAPGYFGSAIASATYSITPTATSPAEAPTFSPGAGSYSSAQSVAMSDSTPGATIHYTSDGSTPTASSTSYTGPITVSSSETLKAIAVASGYSTSAVVSAKYTITRPAVAPTFDPVGGHYTTPQTVTITDATPGAVIHYTLDGTTPTSSSATYTGPISVASTTTVRALAVASGYTSSTVVGAIYTISVDSGSDDSSGGGGGATDPMFLSLLTAAAALRRRLRLNHRQRRTSSF